MGLKLAINPILTFKTSKGSQYWLDKNGRSQRNKSYHPNHGFEDQGLKNPYDNVIFVNNSDASHLAYATVHKGTWWMIIRNGKVGIITLGASNSLQIVSGLFNYRNKPLLGFAPIEIQKLKYAKNIKGYYVQGKFHIGNKIVEMEYLDGE